MTEATQTPTRTDVYAEIRRTYEHGPCNIWPRGQNFGELAEIPVEIGRVRPGV
jgi:hypothetical protein